MSLLVPVTPSNFRGPSSVLMESDVFNICERVKELDPRLRVHALTPPITVHDRTYNYAVTELCGDGVERLVTRVAALDARIIEHLHYMLGVPFEQRLAAAEAEAAKFEAAEHEKQMDDLYERVGGPLNSALHRYGFTDTRPVNYPLPRRRR